MTSISEPVKTMGTAAFVFLILTLVGWAALLRSIAIWIGKEPVAGRESDRVILQAWSGGIAVLVWILLAGLLLIASSKNALPGAVGAVAWIVHPLSLVAALAAIAVLYDPHKKWPSWFPRSFRF